MVRLEADADWVESIGEGSGCCRGHGDGKIGECEFGGERGLRRCWMLGAGVWSSRVKAREASGDLTSSGGRAGTERQSLRREPCQVPASTHWPGRGGGGGQVSGITGEAVPPTETAVSPL